jgi:hypothetical protein
LEVEEDVASKPRLIDCGAPWQSAGVPGPRQIQSMDKVHKPVHNAVDIPVDNFVDITRLRSTRRGVFERRRIEGKGRWNQDRRSCFT